MYLLDTNVLSAARRPERAPQIMAWLGARSETELFLSVITLGEIERGICAQERVNPGFAADLRVWVDRTVRLFSDRILQFGVDDARIWGRLSQDIGHGGADLMIAATALARGATVVTGNTDDFRPTGVRLENPFQA
jgi:predicted nucleic acid-binding protein